MKVVLALAMVLMAGEARAQTPPPAAPPAPPSGAAPAPSGGTPALPPPVAPTPEPSAAAAPVTGATAAETAPAPHAVPPVETADASGAPSDHDLVVGHVGIEVRRVDAGPFAFDLRSGTGCPMAQTTPCRVTLGALSLRWWQSRNLALSGGLAMGFGGGRDGGRALDSYVGLGPVVGLALLLGNWRHLAISATPDASFVYFKPGGDSTTSTKVVTVRGALEGELHFGFVGVPALSVGMATGVGFHWVSMGDARVWSVGVVGPGSVWDVLSTLFVRYYL